MKYTLILLILFMVLTACNNETVLKSSVTNFNKDWKFKKFTDDKTSEECFEIEFNAEKWDDVTLPHTAKIEPLIVNDQWQGVSWYRKKFFVEDGIQDKKILFEFEAAMNVSEYWINGKKVYSHRGGYLPVVFDASDFIVAGDTNLIAVKLDNRDNSDTGPKPLEILDFCMYGGLHRNAWMHVKDKVYISHPVNAEKVAGGGVFITTPTVDEEESTVNVKTHLINEFDATANVTLKQIIINSDKRQVHEKSRSMTLKAQSEQEIEMDFTISEPALWSPDNPDLYELHTVVLFDGKEIENRIDRFGIRQFIFKDRQLYVNGKRVHLRGVNRHQEYPFIGYALSDNAQFRDAKKIKDAGFNCIRLSHYPHSPAFMDACDEFGIIVLDAILGWQYFNDTDAFRNYCYKSARYLVRRDRNHPCVLAWEVSLNETAMPDDFKDSLHRIAHEEYPGEYVYTCGWLSEPYDIYLQARQHRLKHYDSTEVKPYFVSEYGDWEYFAQDRGLNQHNLPRNLRIEKSSRQKRAYGEKRLLQQAFNVQEAHNDNYNTPAFGDGYWVMYDYNRGYDNDHEASGLMDIFRIPKFAWNFYQSQQEIEKDTVLKIASFWTEDSDLDVRVFSNCDEVELFVNEKSVGRNFADKGINSTNLKYPPFTFKLDEYETGELKALAYKDGILVKEDLVRTPGPVSSVRFKVDESGKVPEAGCNDIVFLYLEFTDVNGTINPFYAESLSYQIEGDAEVMNQGEIKAEAGIATMVIRIGENAGPVSVTTIAPGTESVSFEFITN